MLIQNTLRACQRFSCADTRVRFAPSPTGQLHIGGLRTALFNYLFAKSHNGSFILRIEDTDQTRLVPGSTDSINGILTHYGLMPDEGSEQGGAYGPYLQSQRLRIYEEYSHRLIESGHGYRCFCSSERLELLRKEAARTNQVPKYDKRCRLLSQEESMQRSRTGEKFVVRFKLDLQDVAFKDRVFGDISQTLDESDPILVKADGYPTYHFANIIDDRLMKISHVIRGMEWLSSTGKHVLLYKTFEWEPPVFMHLPLLTRDGKQKLSKRHADAFVDYYHKEKGFLPVAVLNLLIRNGSGIKNFDSNHLYTLEEMVTSFDASLIGKRNLQVDPSSLEHYGRLAFQNSPINQLIPLIRDRVANDLPGCESVCDDPVYMEKIIRFLREREERFHSLAELTTPQYAFFFTRPVDASAITCKYPAYEAKEILEAVLLLAEPENLKTLRDLADRFGSNHRKIYGILRISITGHATGPPIAELYEFFGREECTSRIRQMISFLS